MTRFLMAMAMVATVLPAQAGVSSGWSSGPIVPLTKDRNDIFGAGAEAARFLETLRFPGKVRCDLGHLQLALENPEQYRAKLLGLIAQEIKQTRERWRRRGMSRWTASRVR